MRGHEFSSASLQQHSITGSLKMINNIVFSMEGENLVTTEKLFAS
jgi:hypothetical protein